MLKRTGSIASTTPLPRSSYAVLEACACQQLHQNRSREISPVFCDRRTGVDGIRGLRRTGPKGPRVSGMSARGPKRLATSMSFVGDRGAICRSSCAQPRAAAAASTAETMTIPVSPAFASRATCRRRTTSARCLAGSDRGPCPSRCRNGRREAKSATTTAPHCGRSMRLRHTWDRWRGRCLRFRLSARPRPS